MWSVLVAGGRRGNDRTWRPTASRHLISRPRWGLLPDALLWWQRSSLGTTAGPWEGTFARRAPGIQINVLAIYPNALPPNITPSSSPGYLTPAVSGAQVWAEWLHHPCLLGGPQHGDIWGKGGTTGGK